MFQKLQATKAAACSKIDTKSKQTHRRIHFWDITVYHWQKRTDNSKERNAFIFKCQWVPKYMQYVPSDRQEPNTV